MLLLFCDLFEHFHLFHECIHVIHIFLGVLLYSKQSYKYGMSIMNGVNILQIQRRILLPKEKKIRRIELKNRRKIDYRTWKKLQNLVLYQGLPRSFFPINLEAFAAWDPICFCSSEYSSLAFSCAYFVDHWLYSWMKSIETGSDLSLLFCHWSHISHIGPLPIFFSQRLYWS